MLGVHIQIVHYRACPGGATGLVSTVSRSKVSFWGSGTLKIVTLVENHPQKRVRVCFGWMIITPLEGSGVY